MHKHSGCCGCSAEGMGPVGRRSFLAAVGGTAVGAAALAGCATTATREGAAPRKASAGRMKPSLDKRALVVQPVLVYAMFKRQQATSWRPWGGLHTEADVERELRAIEEELKQLAAQAEFRLTIRPVARATNKDQAVPLRDGDADVMLVYGASGGMDVIETLISPKRSNLVFVRHQKEPAYLWYEIIHPCFLRKYGDAYAAPGLDVYDVIVDAYPDMLWRLRALYALKNTVGSRIVAIGSASGWGAGGPLAPKTAVETWKMEVQDEPYEDLGKRIAAAKADPARVRQAEVDAAEYLKLPGTTLGTDQAFVSRAFLLKDVFEDVMADAKSQAITINNCMSTIMPMSETTACLVLSLLNDSGALAFCESDFVVIPSGVLLHHVASTPVFLQDPTYPHNGMVTVAHCTAPRKMDGKRLEKAQILTHFESDYGAAPKVDMRLGQVITMLDPDFANKQWIGFRGKVAANPFLDICRSQTDVTIEGDWRKLMADMRGFHWMLAYGDHLKETGYALRKLGIGWYNLSDDRSIEG